MFGTGSVTFAWEESFSQATFFKEARLEMSSISAESKLLFLFIVSRTLSSEALLFVSSTDTSESINSGNKREKTYVKKRKYNDFSIQ